MYRERPSRHRFLAVLSCAATVAATVVLAPLALTVGSTVTAAPAAADTLYGHDVSWPQCSAAQGGYDLPMPPESTAFVVVGLTAGLPFTTNPCLSSQITWATSRTKPTYAYTMAGFPTSAQLTTYGSAGPWSSTTRAGRLGNVGYAEGEYAVDVLSAAGFRPTMVWVDVEPRPKQPWPGGTSVAQAENRQVLLGLIRRLDEAGYAYGLYSNASGWAAIVGSWRLPGIPFWATAGPRGAEAALAMCAGPSVSGGPVHLAQWWDDTRDYDLTCPAYVHAPVIPPAPSAGSDFDGDWANDLVARQVSDGSVWLYRGNGRSGWYPRTLIGTRWQGMDVIDTPGDLSADGGLDVLARYRTTGDVFLYPWSGTGWLTRSVVARWPEMDMILGVGDFSGDGWPDVVSRERTTGALWLYPRTPTGSWLPRVRIGSGWLVMDAVLGGYDLDGNGVPDLLAREKATGYLWLYPRSPAGTFGKRVQIGRGWSTMDAIAMIGDVNGDAVPDVLAREKATGYLWLYPRSATGWLTRVRVGTYWQVMNVIT